MSWWRRLFLDPMPEHGSQSALDLDHPERTEQDGPSAAHAELLGRLDRLQGDVAKLASTDVRADLVERLDWLLADVAKLGREQFQATTLLEGHDTLLEELAEASREGQDRREDAALQERRARAEIEARVRLDLVNELLPVADALDASVQASRDLLAELRCPPPSAQPSHPSRLAWLRARVVPRQTVPRQADVVADETVGDRAAAFDAWLRGLLLIQGRLQSWFEREGVRPIRALGQPFDPHRHLAVATSHENGVPDGTVVAEELRGYMAGDRVLRPAEVVVVRAAGEPRRADRNTE